MVYLSCISSSIKMRTIISLVTVFFVFINLEMKAESFTVFINENQTTSKDSINQTIEGKKEGYWIIYGKMRNLPDYKPDGIIEEGVFKSSRKIVSTLLLLLYFFLVELNRSTRNDNVCLSDSKLSRAKAFFFHLSGSLEHTTRS